MGVALQNTTTITAIVISTAVDPTALNGIIRLIGDLTEIARDAGVLNTGVPLIGTGTT